MQPRARCLGIFLYLERTSCCDSATGHWRLNRLRSARAPRARRLAPPARRSNRESLFSAEDLARAHGHLAIAVHRLDGMSAVSVTPAFLAHVCELLFVVTGSGKRAAVAALTAGVRSPASVCKKQFNRGCRGGSVTIAPNADVYFLLSKRRQEHASAIHRAMRSKSTTASMKLSWFSPHQVGEWMKESWSTTLCVRSRSSSQRSMSEL